MRERRTLPLPSRALPERPAASPHLPHSTLSAKQQPDTHVENETRREAYLSSRLSAAPREILTPHPALHFQNRESQTRGTKQSAASLLRSESKVHG